MNTRANGFRIFAQVRSWLRASTRRGRLESEMESELAHHLECMTADLVRAGLGTKEAARRARMALGAPLLQKEEMRASLGLRWWDELRADVRFGVRLLRKSPGFTAIAAGSLALAIGANTTIFSVAKELLYDHLNVPHPEQLRLFHWAGDKNVAVHGLWGDWNRDASGITSTSFSYPAFEQLRRDNRELNDLFAFKNAGRLNATIDGEAQVIQGDLVSGNYFAELQVMPQLGRAIEPSDDRDGAPPVALLSAPFWQRAFGGSRDVVGHTIKINMTPVTIIGVTPRGFTGAKSVQSAPDVFLPFSLQPVVLPRFGGVLIHDGKPRFWWINIMARSREGVADSKARAALDVSLSAVTRATVRPGSTDTIPHIVLSDGSRGLFQSKDTFGKPIYVLLAVVGFVLLLACANIASLLLARCAARQREISVRLALGAGRKRVLRQIFTECLLLSMIGGLAGFALAFAGRSLIPALLANPWEANHLVLSFDWGIFGFTALLTLGAGFLFGMAPAIAATRNNVNASLKETAQTITRRRKGFGGKSIVAFQLTLSTLLVVGAVLFARTLYNLNHSRPGFDTDHLLLFAVEQPESRYPTPAEIELHRRILEAVSALPGMESASIAQTPYLADNIENEDFLPEGQPKDPSKEQTAYNNVVGLNFFKNLGIPMLAGRGFNEGDTRTSAKVAVISQKLAARAFPGLNPIGKHFHTHEEPLQEKAGDWLEVVGVCGDTRYENLRAETAGVFYEPYTQAMNLNSGMTYEVRTHMAAASLAPALRRAVQSIDPDLPIQDLRTQREQIDATMQQERIFAALTAGFAFLALLLASVGVYGTMAYSVAQRTNEIGLRLALGAKPRQVRAMVLREASWLSAAGIAAGMGAALLLTRLVRSMLFGLQPTDPASLAGGAALLVFVALAASWIPAHRAAGVQPMDALRHE
jgi:predicted permease